MSFDLTELSIETPIMMNKLDRKYILSLILGAVVIAAVMIAGTVVYRQRIVPFRTAVLVVEGNAVTMRYLIKRLRISGEEPIAMLNTIVYEQVLRHEAPKAPYNLQVDQAEVEQYLRALASGDEQRISEDEFVEWERQALNETGLSRVEFEEIARTRILGRKMADWLGRDLENPVEQVQLVALTVPNLAKAQELKRRLEDQADLNAIQRDPDVGFPLGGVVGEPGWFPRRGLPTLISNLVFDEMGVGDISEPVIWGGDQFAIVIVTGKAEAKEIDDGLKRNIKAVLLDVWLTETAAKYNVSYHGFSNGYDAETDAWLREQLRRDQR